MPGECDVIRQSRDARGMPQWWTSAVFNGMKANLGLGVLICAQSVYIIVQVQKQALKYDHINTTKRLSIRLTAYLLFIYIILYIPETLNDFIKPYFKHRVLGKELPINYHIYKLIRKTLVQMNPSVNVLVYAATKQSNRDAYRYDQV